VNSTPSNDLSEVAQLNQKFKFGFMDEVSGQSLKRLVDSYGPTSDFSVALEALRETSTAKCLPLSAVISGLSEDLAELNEKFAATTAVTGAIEGDVLLEIQDLASKVKYRVLKSVETVFKEVSEAAVAGEHPGELFEVESRLIGEGLNGFVSSVKTLDMAKVNGLVRSCLVRAVEMCEVSSGWCVNDLRRILVGVSLVCEVFVKFVRRWTKYLVEAHRETGKCLYAVLFVFGELKTKGFGLPEDFEEEEADENENRNPNRKFELDGQVIFGRGYLV